MSRNHGMNGGQKGRNTHASDQAPDFRRTQARFRPCDRGKSDAIATRVLSGITTRSTSSSLKLILLSREIRVLPSLPCENHLTHARHPPRALVTRARSVCLRCALEIGDGLLDTREGDKCRVINNQAPCWPWGWAMGHPLIIMIR